MKDKEGFVRLQGMLSSIHLVPKVFNYISTGCCVM